MERLVGHMSRWAGSSRRTELCGRRGDRSKPWVIPATRKDLGALDLTNLLLLDGRRNLYGDPTSRRLPEANSEARHLEWSLCSRISPGLTFLPMNELSYRPENRPNDFHFIAGFIGTGTGFHEMALLVPTHMPFRFVAICRCSQASARMPKTVRSRVHS